MSNSKVIAFLLVLALLSGCSYMPSWLGGKKEEKAKLPGDRIAVLPAGTDIRTDDSLKGVAITLPPPALNVDWPQHSGMIPAASGNLAVKGDFSTTSSATAGDGEAFEHIMVPQPVVASGMVFAMDAVGNISAHDAATIGTVHWKSKGVWEKDKPDVMGGGLAFDQGKLYALSGRGAIVALDASTGKEFWRKDLHFPLRSPPRVEGGKLFVITIDNQIYALNAATGDLLWDQRGIGETAGLMNSVSPTVAGDVVIVPYSSGEIYALSTADGKEVWSDSLSPGKRTEASAFLAGIGGDLITDGGVVFAASNSGMMSVFAVANGQRLWDKPLGAINTPWLAGDNLFLLTSDNTLVAMVKYTGRVFWATKLPGFANEKEKKDPITWRGPVMANGKLAVVSSNGQLLLISAADGKIAATKEIPEHIYTAPVIAGGIMYLVGQDATLYSLQ